MNREAPLFSENEWNLRSKASFEMRNIPPTPQLMIYLCWQQEQTNIKIPVVKISPSPCTTCLFNNQHALIAMFPSSCPFPLPCMASSPRFTWIHFPSPKASYVLIILHLYLGPFSFCSQCPKYFSAHVSHRPPPMIKDTVASESGTKKAVLEVTQGHAHTLCPHIILQCLTPW